MLSIVVHNPHYVNYIIIIMLSVGKHPNNRNNNYVKQDRQLIFRYKQE